MVPPRRLRSALGLLLAVLLVAALPGCGLLDADQDGGAGHARATQVAEQVADTLRTRVRAVRAGDRDAFLATVARHDAGLVRRQRTWFDNLVQLPLGRFDLRLDARTLAREGRRWTAQVEVRVQLEGFDRWPVVTRVQQEFAPSRGGAAYALVQDRHEAAPGEHPWERGPVVVRRRAGVLGVFDAASASRADALLAAVAEGAGLVAREVPYAWDRRVVVYALSDTRALRSIADLPGGDPNRLDGVSLPVGRRGGRAAAIRLVLHPRMLDAPAAQRDRLVRHELTHIAIAERDDAVPTWLSEGIAEYVSVQPVPVGARTLPRAALAAAADPPLLLPDGATFNGPGSQAHYGVSWWACEALVDLYGEEVLWRLVAAVAASGAEQWEEVLAERLDLTPRHLAEEARRRMLAAYG